MKRLALLMFLCLALVSTAPSVAAAPSSTIQVDIPDFVIEETEEGRHIATIPGGDLLGEANRPLVPYYTVTVEYPTGYRVQRVVMVERTGLVEASELNLTVVPEGEIGDGGTPPGEWEGWFPESDFDWRVQTRSDGSSLLTVLVYAFHYDPATLEARFYGHYAFDVSYIETFVSILELATDERVYDPGEEVTVDVTLENTGPPEDVVVSPLVWDERNEPVEGLPPRTLQDLEGEASLSLTWDSGGHTTGLYYVEVVLNDTEGNWLDRDTTWFEVGRPMLNVTAFSVAPGHIEIGDEVVMELTLKNTGSTELTGSCLFKVVDAGSTVETFDHSFVSLEPGGSISFASTWDTSGIEEGAVYHVLGYALYVGKTTPIHSAQVSTNILPTAEFGSSLDEAGTGELVSFDASISEDPDGSITAYSWSFGDGAEASGEVVKHAYQEEGEYEVTLMVFDDEGGVGSARAFLTVYRSCVLTVSTNVPGLELEGSGRYRERDEVTLTAPPAGMEGFLGTLGGKYVFQNWAGDVESTDSPTTLLIGGVAEMNVEAVYTENYTMPMALSAVAVVVVAALALVAVKGLIK